jgi:tRNA modification GTPase
VIEVRLVIAGVPVMVSDTAGLRAGGVDAIEVIGIGRAERAAQQADVLIWMTAADAAGVCPPPRVPDLVLLNKVDLEVAGVVENMIRMRNNSALPISIKSGAGMSELKTRLEEIIGEKLAGASSAIVVRERHRVAISESIRILNNIQAKNELPLELLAESLRDVARLLGTITGHVGVEDILGEIFSSFCIGK